MAIKDLDELLKMDYEEKAKLVVVASHDEVVLEAIIEASSLGIAEPILIGDKLKIKEIAREKNLSIDGYEIIDEKDLEKSAEIGVKLVNQGKADFIMKGLVDTGTLMKAVLNKEWGLRTNNLLSHVMVYDVATYSKLIYLTDGGMNLYPDLDQKTMILENSIAVAKALGNKEIKVVCLAAKEKVDLKMPATVDAMALTEKYKEGYFEEGVIVEGPMALDLAISKESAEIKNYKSQVAGEADILLVPNIEMGNGIGKSITYFANGKSAGVIMGARAPIVLVSRADSYESKLYSIALGSLVSKYK